MQKLYEISLIIHFDEKDDPNNINNKIASECLSTRMAGGEGIPFLSLMIHFEEKDDPNNINNKIASECLSARMAGGEGTPFLSFLLSYK